ncbi:MAG: helix-turn-helix transcriptional regulator [Candidatus Omnitrophota bacterium]
MKEKTISDRVVEYVLTVPDHEFAELTAAVLAHSFCMDRTKLSRHFKRGVHMTLEDFLIREKMTRAAFLLKAQERITVEEVSKKIGYSTADYFIRKFKSYYGIAPGKYREYKQGRS